MTKNPSLSDDEFHRRVGEVLHYLWDPIGVSAVPQARDEYDSYVPHVVGLLKSNADAKQIADYLNSIVVDRMSLGRNDAQNARVAKILIAWRGAYEP